MSTAQTYVVHCPAVAGTYAQKFGWRVSTPDGYTAYSGGRAACIAYAAAMDARLAREAR
jgi:methenyltetrahydromethanopterin cyclohydrolase